MARRAGRSPRGIHHESLLQPGKPPLVLVMGYAGGLASWGERFLERCAERFSYLVLDNRGTGQSIKPEPAEDYAVETMADDLSEVVRAVFPGLPVHLLGYSMGGQIAMDAALRRLFPIAKLTLVASTAGGAHYVSPGEAVLKALAEPKGETLIDFFAATWRVCMGEETTARLWTELLEIFEAQSQHLTPRRVMRGHLAAYRRFSAGDRLADLAVPTQIITGLADPLTPPENSRTLARLIPGARLHLMPDIKHNPHLEDPAALLELIESF